MIINGTSEKQRFQKSRSHIIHCVQGKNAQKLFLKERPFSRRLQNNSKKKKEAWMLILMCDFTFRDQDWASVVPAAETAVSSITCLLKSP